MAPLLSVLVFDDQLVNRDLIESISNKVRFTKWLKPDIEENVVQVQVDSSHDGSGTSAAPGSPLTQERLETYSAIVVDLRMPAALDGGRKRSRRNKSVLDSLEEIGYGGICILRQLSDWGLLSRTILHSANIENLLDDVEMLVRTSSRVDEVRTVFEEWVRNEGLTVCPKGNVTIDLEIQLFALLKIELGNQNISSTVRREILRMSHRGVRSNALPHALILGESGTGKEYTAHLIHAFTGHYLDILREEPFYRARHFPHLEKDSIPKLGIAMKLFVGGASTSDESVLADLFGVSKGYATQVVERLGILPAAVLQNTNFPPRNVTSDDQVVDIFLDELGDLSAKAQNALLRVIETGEYQILGGATTYTLKDPGGLLHIRIIAATSSSTVRGIAKGKQVEEVEQGSGVTAFRKDLIYRLGLPPTELKPLGAGDIRGLVKLFFRRRGTLLKATLEKAVMVTLEEWATDGPSRVFTGNHRHFLQFLEAVTSHVEERILHPVSYFDERARKILIEDLLATRGPVQVFQEESSEGRRKIARRYSKKGFAGARPPDYKLTVLRMLEGENKKVAEMIGISPSALSGPSWKAVLNQEKIALVKLLTAALTNVSDNDEDEFLLKELIAAPTIFTIALTDSTQIDSDDFDADETNTLTDEQKKQAHAIMQDLLSKRQSLARQKRSGA